MTRADLLALAARCEAAQGADRELDADIHWALLPDDRRGWMGNGQRCEKMGNGAALVAVRADRITLPRYTSSLDAAASLAPEGWRWSLDYTQRPPYQNCGCASLFAPGSGFEPADVSEVYAATPALALCAAALRAIAATMEGEG